jgi:prepilin-type N-terminal cleavage/methylation domain-containing protein
MLTLLIKISNYRKHHSNLLCFFNRVGFTLIEILATLVLIGFLSSLALKFVSSENNRDLLSETEQSMNRAVRLAGSNSIVSNRITRIHFKTKEHPVTFTIEEASHSDILLTSLEPSESSREEEEEKNKSQKELDTAFIPIELQEEKELKDYVYLSFVHDDGQNIAQQGPDYYFYFFPSGERDQLSFYFATDTEMMVLTSDSFKEELTSKFPPFLEFASGKPFPQSAKEFALQLSKESKK